MKKNKWIVWNVALATDGTLEGFDYKLSENLNLKKYTCSLPLVHFQELAGKYAALLILRTSECRPRDPYELVRFIEEL